MGGITTSTANFWLTSLDWFVDSLSISKDNMKVHACYQETRIQVIVKSIKDAEDNFKSNSQASMVYTPQTILFLQKFINELGRVVERWN